MNAWLRERRAILTAAVGSRVLVLAAAAAGHRLHWPGGPVPVHGASTTHTLSILSYWDGVWYRTVAEQGYLLIPGRQSDPAFFPLFPIVLRALRELGFSFLTTGILVANGAFVIGIIGAIAYARWAKKKQERTGEQSPVALVALLATSTPATRVSSLC